MCGIADYTSFLTREMTAGRWGVLSFDLQNPAISQVEDRKERPNNIWYGIPGFEQFSAPVLRRGLSQLGAEQRNAILWFQHEHGIWRNDQAFISMLRQLDLPKVVTLHTVHFQSLETPSGLRSEQYDFLRRLLPEVEAITVFSHGAHRAVTRAFPQYRDKVHVIKHGVPSHPEVTSLTRRQAKQKLNDFLAYDSDLDPATRKTLHRQGILKDDDTFVIGEAGFLCPGKQAEMLFLVRDLLAGMCPGRRIVALRIGAPRDDHQKEYAAKLSQDQNGTNKFLVQTCLPEDMLRVAQRAFDVNLYWPETCTQSGILAHALGAGAIVAGRDMEGSGEMLKEAGAITGKRLRSVIERLVTLMSHPATGNLMERRALEYAAGFSWATQAREHFELASRLMMSSPGLIRTYETADDLSASSPRYAMAGV